MSLRHLVSVSLLSIVVALVAVVVSRALDDDVHVATASGSVLTGTEQDSADVVVAVRRYGAALAAGDTSGALALLSADALILESGGMETVTEYRAHHLPADMAFAAGVPSEKTVQRVQVRGDMAWVATTSISQGNFRGRAINSAGAELVVLTRTSAGWRITAIHWSSRTRRQQ
jgi:ketosteroid isomerase-like protein